MAINTIGEIQKNEYFNYFLKKDWEQINLKTLYCKIFHILSITCKSKES